MCYHKIADFACGAKQNANLSVTLWGSEKMADFATLSVICWGRPQIKNEFCYFYILGSKCPHVLQNGSHITPIPLVGALHVVQL
jgi:hypothetical protein